MWKSSETTTQMHPYLQPHNTGWVSAHDTNGDGLIDTQYYASNSLSYGLDWDHDGDVDFKDALIGATQGYPASEYQIINS